MTVRLRLTLLYGGLFLAAGAVLLTFTYLFVAHSPWPGEPDAPDAPAVGDLPGAGLDVDEPDRPVVADGLAAAGDAQRDDDLRRLMTGSVVALAALAVAAAGLGWYVAGRVLRPIATITTRTRRISAENLHERLQVRGPDDELTTLAATIDQLLDRLDGAFESQRRFVANASHELRTPLTVQRALLEVALADPEADVDSLRAAARDALANLADQERLIEALLVLARSQRGVERRAPTDLAAVAGRVMKGRQPAVAARRLRVDVRLDPAPVVGDVDLLERMVANLVDNAVAHNVAGGWVEVTTSGHGGHARLRVANSGGVVPTSEVPRLFEPFQRRQDRTGGSDGSRDDGVGLGLSIVDAVVRAHGGRLTTTPVPDGGLAVEVHLARHVPVAPASGSTGASAVGESVDEPSGRG